MEASMQRILSALLLLFVASLPAAAEEISLKDGTKIVGHMTAFLGDKIEVETAYGKMQLKRSDILTISFPENNTGTTSAASSAKSDGPPNIEDSLRGTQYVNKTGKFSLTLPANWKINRNSIHLSTTVAGLSSQDDMRYLIVSQEEYTGSLESYEGIIEINVRKGLANYEKLMKSPITIDGKPALLVSYRGLSKDNNVPIQFLVAMIPSGNTITKVTAWCVEPLFHETQPAFEKIMTSYRSTGQISAAAASSKP
jgi:hypothetical protein